MDKAEARQLVDQIKASDENGFQLRCRAYVERAWEPLGYPTWEAMCDVEFPRMKLTPAQRKEQIAEMQTEYGMSNYAVAAALGVTEMTVRRDRAAGRPVPGATNVDPAPRRPAAGQVPEPATPAAGRPVPGATNVAPAPRRPAAGQVLGQDGKIYPAKRTPREPAPTPAVSPADALVQETIKLIDRANQLAAARNSDPLQPLEDFDTQFGVSKREGKRLVALGRLPREVQQLVISGAVGRSFAEDLSTAQLSDDDKIGFAHKVADGMVGGNRETLREALRTFGEWEMETRGSFLVDATLTYAEAKERNAAAAAEARLRKSRQRAARRTANATPRVLYGVTIVERLRSLNFGLIDLIKHVDDLGDMREAALDLVEDIHRHSLTLLNENGRPPATKQDVAVWTPPGGRKDVDRKDLYVIDGELG